MVIPIGRHSLRNSLVFFLLLLKQSLHLLKLSLALISLMSCLPEFIFCSLILLIPSLILLPFELNGFLEAFDLGLQTLNLLMKFCHFVFMCELLFVLTELESTHILLVFFFQSEQDFVMLLFANLKSFLLSFDLSL